MHNIGASWAVEADGSDMDSSRQNVNGKVEKVNIAAISTSFQSRNASSRLYSFYLRQRQLAATRFFRENIILV